MVELRLVFGCGKAGNAEVGGSYGGCDGRGRVVAIIEDSQGRPPSAELSTKETSGCDDEGRWKFKRAMLPCLHEIPHKILGGTDPADFVLHLT